MIPSILAKQLEQGIGDYIETTFPMTNEPFKGSMRNFISSKDSVYHEPYIAVRLPFRVASQMPELFEAIHPKYLPYVHQQKAFERLTGDDGRSTLVATGTGSGKTECFLYPILEYCYQHRGERGIKALIIYPMNALATDQAKRIAELIYESPELKGNVTAGMYVGGQEHTPSRMMSEHSVITDHETLLNSPPDIMMTNYKMLDYLLVRPKDSQLWQDNHPETLKYIAVDELHTFDGAQGTDLACLLRRLKRRLGIYDGFLCCIGTSATMGSRDSNGSIIEYASEIFGEPFERDSVITEDRLSPGEFFLNSEVTEFSMPDEAQTAELKRLASEDDWDHYLSDTVKAWFPDFEEDVLSDQGRLDLGSRLMHHSFMQSLITLTGGNYWQESKIADELSVQYPELKKAGDSDAVLDSFFALISHARTGAAGKLRPFLFVQVQLWIRELRRLVAKVDAHNVTYEIAHDLNKQQAKQYLPVVNCRDCGMTGWVSILNERQNASMPALEGFYNRYFKADDKICMMFPRKSGETMPNMMPAKLCPDCLQVTLGDNSSDFCPSCGTEMVPVLIPSKISTSGSKEHKQYVCPCCGSKRGLSLIGVRSATEISSTISQMFSSKFNDDKKTLAFSDSVQDASHRAAFFNSRTWRFGLRTAIQRYCTEEGAGKSLQEFQDGFIRYWHDHLSDEDFMSFFIAPNMTWRHAYEDMVENRKLASDKAAKDLMREVESRLQYEIMLEYGLNGRIGRTLEKSGCSVLSFAPDDVHAIAERVQERSENEIGLLREEGERDYERMVIGVLDLMRKSGAFQDPVFREYINNNFKSYFLSNDRNRWLPGLQSGRNTPRFVAEGNFVQRKPYDVDTVSSHRYIDWIESCCKTVMVESSTLASLVHIILEESERQGVVTALTPSPGLKVYALNKEKISVSPDVVSMRCDTCGAVYSVSKEDSAFWKDASCLRAACAGCLQEDPDSALGYYGKLYSSGDLERINAREHTGLLERDDREKLESDFKRGKDLQRLWDPNVLSCTPTLEMGIDIGDLSTVILCSMPPEQSKFLQRAGRAGRRDGNALTLAVANARPHDLYFYADPMDMIAGNVTPPRIFLRASAVLERQFVAFCMDSWVKRGVPDGAIPDQIGKILNQLSSRPSGLFPFNFLNYVKKTLSRQLNSFIQMFAGSWGTPEEAASVREEMESFARGKGSKDSPMYIRILDAFEDMKKQQDALKSNIKDLKGMIRDLEAKPKDSSYDEEIKELKGEQSALMNVLQEIGKKNVFNFLSDEGLLPNYAFPEQGIVLKAVLYRREDEAPRSSANPGKNYEKSVYEYSRSASSAISEFAPNNSFYAGGRKLKIDQVDLTTAQAARWRLCPNCSHAEIEEAGKHTASCPVCGSPAWADAGQVRSMLKVQMVYSNMDYTKSLVGDESEERSNTFYVKQLLVDVDEDHDITSAYQMDNDDFPFGYEFVRKATLREINFGEADTSGEKMTVAGEENVRKGFKICRYCGKIQPETGGPNHSYYCKTRKNPALAGEDAYEECLFLYREFQTEILRLLIPATTMDSTDVKLESFVAAFMLGMKEYFGNVDHLRATVSEVPVPDADYRKQYLVIYDSVPGGTGYLKQLMTEKDALIRIFEKALAKMENCSCKDDPNKDGCYHCLFAYRQSRQIGSISRKAAIRMLKSILSGKGNITKIRTIGEISANPIFDSELEQEFMEAVRLRAGSANVKDSMRNGKHCYYVALGDMTWEIEPQVLLDAEQGVKVPSKPDFIFWPVKEGNHLPVAVFTDGFTYHQNIAAEDTLKRESIRRSGNFRVWSLSYDDVQSVFTSNSGYLTETLHASEMPSGNAVYLGIVMSRHAETLSPEKLSPFDQMMFYLTEPDSEMLFRVHAYAYSLSLLDRSSMGNKLVYDSWHEKTGLVEEQTHYTNVDYVFPGTIFGSWMPGKKNGDLMIYSGILKESMKQGESAAVCAVLRDDKNKRSERYEREWNGFLEFSNIMQFASEYVGVATTGLEEESYLNNLPVNTVENVEGKPALQKEDGWDKVFPYLLGEESKAFANKAKDADVPAPSDDDIGYEVENSTGEVIATIEIAWPAQKAAYLSPDQLEDKEKLISSGWKIFDESTIDELKKTIGGES